MRVLLALLFLTPLVVYAALQSGAEAVTPYIAALGLVALLTQILIERRG
ncbi:hypothetical protein [Roseibium sp.]